MQADITIGDKLPAYHTYPDDNIKHPGLIVIHEIWGLTPHIKDVANRFAAEGYDVVAPNLFSELDFGKEFGQHLLAQMQDPETRDDAQKQMREKTAPVYAPEFGATAIAKLEQCVEFLLQDDACNGSVGVVGFCFGGTYAFALAAAEPRIKAAVPFYGRPPAPENAARITAPVLAFYGTEDAPLMETLPMLKEHMHNKDFSAVVYEGAAHAFFNDTNTRMYRKEPAEDAWQKTLAFLANNINR